MGGPAGIRAPALPTNGTPSDSPDFPGPLLRPSVKQGLIEVGPSGSLRGLNELPAAQQT